MQTGTVKWFNSQKGYGFIQPASGGPDIFVHISAVERAGMSGLNEGQKLSYEIVADKRELLSGVHAGAIRELLERRGSGGIYNEFFMQAIIRHQFLEHTLRGWAAADIA